MPLNQLNIKDVACRIVIKLDLNFSCNYVNFSESEFDLILNNFGYIVSRPTQSIMLYTDTSITWFGWFYGV